jgi:hypothetical protein
MTASYSHHERHPADTTTCHTIRAIGFLGEVPVRRPVAEAPDAHMQAQPQSVSFTEFLSRTTRS